MNEYEMKVEAITILPTLIENENKIRDYTIYIYLNESLYTITYLCEIRCCFFGRYVYILIFNKIKSNI